MLSGGRVIAHRGLAITETPQVRLFVRDLSRVITRGIGSMQVMVTSATAPATAEEVWAESSVDVETNTNLVDINAATPRRGIFV